MTELEQWEQKNKNDVQEFGAVFDGAGKLCFEAEGNATCIKWAFYEVSAMRGRIMTHTHPFEVSFSQADVTFALYNGLKEIRVVTPSGIVYSMSGFGSEMLLNLAWVISNVPEVDSSGFRHKEWQRFARKHKLVYKTIKLRARR